MTCAIVTPWRDHLELAPDYFLAIDAAQPDQLVVVDDGSEQPLPFAAIRIEQGGFCTASNSGLALVETDQVVFLNNDVAPMRAGWLDDYRETIRPGLCVGPLRYDKHGQVDGVEYPYVDGWALGMTTEDARSIGGWDELYDAAGPAYFSDNALSFRARMAGLTLRELRPGVKHKGGQTGATNIATFEHALRVNGALFTDQVREALR